MRAISLNGYGGPEVMTWKPMPDPKPGPGEVLLDVVAAGVNRADLLQRRGLYPPPPGSSKILGLECSGTVAALGEGVHGWEPGVIGCVRCCRAAATPNAWRSRPSTQLLPVPAGVDLAAAASLPEIACTVWSNVVAVAATAAPRPVVAGTWGRERDRHACDPGRGGAGRDGRGRRHGSAVQARPLQGVGREHPGELSRRGLRSRRCAATACNGADVILDNMGASYLALQYRGAGAADGQLVIIGLQGGGTGDLNLGALDGQARDNPGNRPARAVRRSVPPRARPTSSPTSALTSGR